MSDESLRQFDAYIAWCREQAVPLMTRACAYGSSIEHEVYRAFPRLFPIVPQHSAWRSAWDLLQTLAGECRAATLLVDIVEVNRLRAEHELPPLTKLPRVEYATRFTPPMPEDIASKEEQERAFHEWAKSKAYDSYEDAALYNSTPRDALLTRLPRYVDPLSQLFPKLRMDWMIARLTEWLPRFRPEELDQERLASRRRVLGTFMQVGEEIQRQVAEQNPEAKA
jgi:hypothetical protein